jgi:hypothetical protein
MRTTTATLSVLLILLAAFSGDAMAQSGGMFGPRVTGGTLQPGRSSQFNNGLQTAPGGSFTGAGRPNGPAMFATPWRQAYPSPPSYSTPVYALFPNGQTAIVVPGGEMLAPGAAASANGTLPTAAQPPATAQPPIAVQAPAAGAPAEGATPAGGESAAVAPPPPAVQLTTASTASAGEADGYLPGVSARLTHIARGRGIAAPAGIRVSLVNGTAVLRGEVATPHDRSLLANLAGLEPGIGRISNELTVASQGPPPGAAAP